MACSLRPVSSCCPKTHPIDLSCTVKYKIKGLLGTGGTKTGGTKMLSKHLEYRITLGCHLRGKSGYVVEPSHKAPNFFLGLGRRQVLYCSYFVMINLNSFLADYETY